MTTEKYFSLTCKGENGRVSEDVFTVFYNAQMLDIMHDLMSQYNSIVSAVASNGDLTIYGSRDSAGGVHFAWSR